MEESTHILFDGKNIVISPDIMPVFSFLMEIEKEIESFLGFNKKLDGIKESHLEMINFVGFLSNKLKENNIDFKYDFKEHPSKIAEKLNFHFPIRSQVIVLFANLDVLFNLHTAYKNETSDSNELRQLTMDDKNAKKFLNDFIFNGENQYYENNKARFSKIDSGKLRGLRNSLVHFFSIGHSGLSLTPNLLSDKSRKFENILKQNKHGNIIFISPEDIYGLIKDATILRMKKWSEDFQDNPKHFKQKMKFVIDLVNMEGAVIVQNRRLNI